jgi:hypothetical protein
MPVGSRVGLSVNNNRDLVLYRDGQLQGTMTTAVPHPVFPLFQLKGYYSQVSASALCGHCRNNSGSQTGRQTDRQADRVNPIHTSQ